MGRRKGLGDGPTRKKGSPEEWSRAPELEMRLKPLIDAHHEHLDNAEILCFFKPRATRKGGRITIAKAMKATPILRAALNLGGIRADYLIVVGRASWVLLDPPTQAAILDHELCHFTGRDEIGRWGLQGHEVEEFRVILERHGAYTFELRQFVKAAQQLELPAEP